MNNPVKTILYICSIFLYFLHFRQQKNSVAYPSFFWPRNQGGKKPKKYGLLPHEVPEIVTYLADPMHWEKSVADILFKDATAPKKTCQYAAFGTNGWWDIQIDIGYFFKMYWDLPLAEFVANARETYEHHFNKQTFFRK